MSNACYANDMIVGSCEVLYGFFEDVVGINCEQILDFCTHVFGESTRLENNADFVNRNNSPIKFDNTKTHVNYLFLKALLAFGSGYRTELHEYHRRGAAETMTFGLLSLYFHLPDLSASTLRGLSQNDVTSNFHLLLEEEYEISPGIYSYRESKVGALSKKIHKVLVDAGNIQYALGYGDFDDYLRYLHEEYKKEEADVDYASYLLNIIPRTFDGFADQGTVKAQMQTETAQLSVILQKKNQLLLSLLEDEIGSKAVYTQDLTSCMYNLTIFVDNVIPCVLQHYKILQLSPELVEKMVKNIEFTETEAYVLRAHSILASELILDCIALLEDEKNYEMLKQVLSTSKTSDILQKFITDDKDRSKRTILPAELDYFLYTQGKLPELRKLPRHVHKTINY